MKTGQEYKDSLRGRNIKVYFKGELLDGNTLIDNPYIRGHVNSAAMTYEMAFDPKYEDLLTATSHLTGKKINRFTHIHQSVEDLLTKVRMLRAVSLNTGTCYQRCVGLDAVNAVYTTTFEMDQKFGTNYHERLVDFLKQWQENDWMVAGAMTDPKGDRSLRPSQQADPDLFVHVTQKDDKGIYVSGAKAHMTGMVNSHWMILMPTSGYGEEDKDYCVCCAVPVDAPGIIHIFGRQTNDGRKEEGEIDQGNACYGVVGGECLTVLEDVFVPWDKVFMCGEFQYSGMLVERFACYHRQNYGGCKGGVSDIVIGAAATIADMSGYSKAAHIKDKLNYMIHLTETLYACSVACSAMGTKTASGAYYVDPLLANVGKHNVTQLIYDIDRIAQDIGGGLLATLPSEADLRSPEVGKYVEKFFKGVASVPTEDRMRMVRLLEVMTGGVALVESMHGAGSPQAQRIMYSKLSNLEAKKAAAKKIAGVKP
ncbi:4-hydroxyphenylacetate 3-hydroxylase family protein [Papillibacter cinnamivorans]|uniref:4-hydroxybutyryl-CoA dehydratase / vinylacetyl-CoA-Delta-isomerase n=1 Tax=Papillibacter cinnamivorans DSM 12816 TaxID=1122930 RepID=A0A1W1YQ18_9FIRM|nr:4-hydroxyphenylacetate 3-hydroxylase N-terminal domain-containing protein [Papillibacter cinnamivorans]SMC37891.1 4-hydroxybutyryl-CoA dehydratase / vinylacetyl-CoA-Delta-isomerase [Papillibacter cinnamivorans DSM 12816]